MANTYTLLNYHVIFSTKNREPWLVPTIEQRIWRIIGGVARTHRMTALQVGGVEDHIHALITAPPTIAPFQIAQYLKGGSSRLIHEEFTLMRGFGWQDGYGAFTVSKSKIPEVTRYIQDQREHHRKKSFQEEYLEFCVRMVWTTMNDISGVDLPSSLTRRDHYFASIPGVETPGYTHLDATRRRWFTALRHLLSSIYDLLFARPCDLLALLPRALLGLE